MVSCSLWLLPLVVSFDYDCRVHYFEEITEYGGKAPCAHLEVKRYGSVLPTRRCERWITRTVTGFSFVIGNGASQEVICSINGTRCTCKDGKYPSTNSTDGTNYNGTGTTDSGTGTTDSTIGQKCSDVTDVTNADTSGCEGVSENGEKCRARCENDSCTCVSACAEGAATNTCHCDRHFCTNGQSCAGGKCSNETYAPSECIGEEPIVDACTCGGESCSKGHTCTSGTCACGASKCTAGQVCTNNECEPEMRECAVNSTTTVACLCGGLTCGSGNACRQEAGNEEKSCVSSNVMNKDAGSGMNTLTIVLIVVAVVVALIILCVIIACVVRRKKTHHAQLKELSEGDAELGSSTTVDSMGRPSAYYRAASNEQEGSFAMSRVTEKSRLGSDAGTVKSGQTLTSKKTTIVQGSTAGTVKSGRTATSTKTESAQGSAAGTIKSGRTATSRKTESAQGSDPDGALTFKSKQMTSRKTVSAQGSAAGTVKSRRTATSGKTVSAQGSAAGTVQDGRTSRTKSTRGTSRIKSGRTSTLNTRRMPTSALWSIAPTSVAPGVRGAVRKYKPGPSITRPIIHGPSVKPIPPRDQTKRNTTDARVG